MEIAKVGVLGAGLMGHGIAQICAQAGWDVVLVEADQERLDKGIAKDFPLVFTCNSWNWSGFM